VTLHTEDMEDSICAVRSMADFGLPLADDMIKDINRSLQIMSKTQPKRGYRYTNPWELSFTFFTIIIFKNVLNFFVHISMAIKSWPFCLVHLRTVQLICYTYTLKLIKIRVFYLSSPIRFQTKILLLGQ